VAGAEVKDLLAGLWRKGFDRPQISPARLGGHDPCDDAAEQAVGVAGLFRDENWSAQGLSS
jgi:hypothetical protein